MCKALKSQRPEGWTDEDCPACLPPLFDENKDAAFIWRVVHRQYIMAEGGWIVDINHAAIHAAMTLYEVEDQRDCFEKVLFIAAHEIKRQNDELKQAIESKRKP